MPRSKPKQRAVRPQPRTRPRNLGAHAEATPRVFAIAGEDIVFAAHQGTKRRHAGDTFDYDPELASPRTRRPGAVFMRRRALVIAALNHWYGLSPGNSILSFEGDRIVIRPEVANLFGIIGAQLIHHVIGGQKSLVCYHCNAFFVPQRIPSTGARQFCPACRKQAKPQQYAMRDYRKRAKANAVASV